MNTYSAKKTAVEKVLIQAKSNSVLRSSRCDFLLGKMVVAFWVLIWLCVFFLFGATERIRRVYNSLFCPGFEGIWQYFHWIVVKQSSVLLYILGNVAPLSQNLVVVCRVHLPHLCGLMGGGCHVLPNQKEIADLWRAMELCMRGSGSDSCVEFVTAFAETVSRATNFDCKSKKLLLH